MSSFYKIVISRKKDAERERENDPESLPLHKKRGGWRRRAHQRLSSLRAETALKRLLPLKRARREAGPVRGALKERSLQCGILIAKT